MEERPQPAASRWNVLTWGGVTRGKGCGGRWVKRLLQIFGRPHGCLQSIMHFELFADIENMAFYRVQGDKKPGGNFLVGGAGGEMDQDFPFPSGQSLGCIILGRCLPWFQAYIFHQDTSRDPHFAKFQGADPFEHDIRLICFKKKAADAAVDKSRYVGIAPRQVEQGDDIML